MKLQSQLALVILKIGWRNLNVSAISVWSLFSGMGWNRHMVISLSIVRHDDKLPLAFGAGLGLRLAQLDSWAMPHRCFNLEMMMGTVRS